MSTFPRLYAILDAATLAARQIPLPDFAQALHTAGIQLLQYRDKLATPETILANAHTLRRLLPSATLILNDHPTLAAQANWDGVHLGQTDLDPALARNQIGPHRLLGLSTHNPAQLTRANTCDADYIAIGPIFPTSTKSDAEPAVGLSALHRARTLTAKPLIAIGGITLDNAPTVSAAGADSLALISALLPPSGQPIDRAARDFIELFR